MFRVKLKAQHVGLQPPSYIWGRRWKIDGAWRVKESPSDSASPLLSPRRSSPSLIGSKWAAVGQTHWLRGFPRELNEHLGRRPLVFLCRLKFGQTPFPLAAKTTFPIKIKRHTHSTSKSCWLKSTQQLPSLILIHRLGVCAFCSCSPADIYNSIWHLDRGGPFGRGWEEKSKIHPFYIHEIQSWNHDSHVWNDFTHDWQLLVLIDK